MYNANVYKIMFGAPSDIKEEYNAFVDIVHKWNNLHSEKYGIILMPLHWSTNSYPLTGKNGQKIINDEVVSKSDLLICVFGSKLGTATDTHHSGTIEEIDEHLKSGKDVMIYFKKSFNINLDNTDFSQLENLKKYKKEIQKKSLYWEFNDTIDFQNKLFEHLNLYVNKYWWNINTENTDSLTKKQNNIELSDFDIERLRNWTKADNPQFFSICLIDKTIYGLGASNQYEVNNGKEKAEWDDYFERMQKYGFIDIEKFNKDGNPIYRLKKVAYDYMDSLEKNK